VKVLTDKGQKGGTDEPSGTDGSGTAEPEPESGNQETEALDAVVVTDHEAATDVIDSMLNDELHAEVVGPLAGESSDGGLHLQCRLQCRLHRPRATQGRNRIDSRTSRSGSP